MFPIYNANDVFVSNLSPFEGGAGGGLERGTQ